MRKRLKWISFVCSFLFIKPQASPSAPPRKLASSPFVSFSLLYFPFSPLTCAMQCNTQGEEGGFTLERPRSQTNLVTNDAKGRARCPSDRWAKILNRKKTRSKLHTWTVKVLLAIQVWGEQRWWKWRRNPQHGRSVQSKSSKDWKSTIVQMDFLLVKLLFPRPQQQ